MQLLADLSVFPKLAFTILVLGSIGFFCTKYGLNQLFSYGGNISSIGFSVVGATAMIATIIIIATNIAAILTCITLGILAFLAFSNS
ncbi:hypothetical protein HCA00_02500 [Listeria booriae]|uniref:Uncharacterized protein n=1 Tax=Listeria booriae TaxID=1552123 RepID=A0A099WAB1_9LIST|nr:hypothetical protein [Listeria booriae]KGL42709.1 hypothetical protein EP57_04415 [Listeria booriae]MBC1559447.1 hypothetical protein [Listeria booriae]MBC1566968.1 hypothetical protein [Listeria booriae]MBC1944990.1 hypothetical protein [Listeria booriae]MBC6127656.1 hypothetical protein [Listeria booriae]